MRYQLEGALIDSGDPQTIVVEATDQAAAVAQANAQGLMVLTVRPASSARAGPESSTTEASQRDLPSRASTTTPMPVPSYRLLYLEAVTIEVIAFVTLLGGLVGLFLAGDEGALIYVGAGLVLLLLGRAACVFRDHVINGWHIRQQVTRRN